MRKFLITFFLLFGGAAWAQTGPPSSVGGLTREVCVPVVVTLNSAYTAGNEVGPLLSLSNMFRSSAQGAPDQGGVLQSIRLNFGAVHTSEYDIYQFSSNPSNTTWTDKTTPSINAADVNLVHPPLKLTNNASGLGTHTVYGADGIGRAHAAGTATVAATTTDYFVIVTQGTPTFTSNPQLCATYLLD